VINQLYKCLMVTGLCPANKFFFKLWIHNFFFLKLNVSQVITFTTGHCLFRASRDSSEMHHYTTIRISPWQLKRNCCPANNNKFLCRFLILFKNGFSGLQKKQF
jgi:hypothetical protein